MSSLLKIVVGNTLWCSGVPYVNRVDDVIRWKDRQMTSQRDFRNGTIYQRSTYWQYIYVYECDSCSKNIVNIHKLILNNTFSTLRNCAVKYKTSFTIKSKFQKNKYSPLSVFCFDLNFFGFKGILPPDTL